MKNIVGELKDTCRGILEGHDEMFEMIDYLDSEELTIRCTRMDTKRTSRSMQWAVLLENFKRIEKRDSTFYVSGLTV